MDQVSDKAWEVLATLLDFLEIDAKVEVFEDDDQLLLHIESPDAGRLIGRGAQTLNALQFVVNRILVKQYEDAPRCQVDAARYRERRKDQLIEKAIYAADRVQRTGTPYRFDTMNAFDRRIVHQALANDPHVITVSEGDDCQPWKTLVVKPADDDEQAEHAS